MRAILSLLRGGSAASAVAHVALTSGGVLALNLVSGVLTARLLGAAGRGEMAALLLWPQFLAQVFVFALPSAVILHVRREPGCGGPVAGRALLLGLAGGMLALLAGVAAMPLLLRNADGTLLTQARWMMVFAPVGTVSMVLTALLQAHDRFHAYNFVRYAPLVITLVAIPVLHAMQMLTPLNGALAYYLPALPVYGWMLASVVRHVRPTLQGRGQARSLLSFSARAYGGEAAGTLLGNLDKLVLVNLLSLPAYGVYVVVLGLSRVIVTFGASIVPVLLPRTAGRPADAVFRSTERALDVATPLLLLVAVAFWIGGAPVLALLYGAEFATEHAGLVLLSLEAVFFTIALVLTQPFLALDRPGLVTLVQAGSMVVILPAMWLLAPHGVTGAALALLITTATRMLALRAAFSAFPEVRPPRVIPDLRESLAWLRRLREAT